MTEMILGLALIAAILVVSAWLTNLFARAMYYRCAGCSALNARRRTHCRNCGQVLVVAREEEGSTAAKKE